ncbi:uncharacterized protein BO80DRAFT_200379 [Aspergillus ibericus CBS 121593]|uniref:Uncharacterized protein n=1 Tax=Aspergillus ibericus CBS 121593 TaxID=1448316 RepID=A0A395GNE9_9EURO|nr:hypothetical protein BO80DRAFT_200379 [Aspergillus ibericus CBS 121593]RAK97030.1 hypothetical protein BO80DRAFT_200379 [Aspergillus ibericus CBS 121593]
MALRLLFLVLVLVMSLFCTIPQLVLFTALSVSLMSRLSTTTHFLSNLRTCHDA